MPGRRLQAGRLPGLRGCQRELCGGQSSAAAALAVLAGALTWFPLASLSGLVTLSVGSLRCLPRHTPAHSHPSFNLEDLQRFIPLKASSPKHAIWKNMF